MASRSVASPRRTWSRRSRSKAAATRRRRPPPARSERCPIAELEVRGLTKRYGRTVAVEDLSFGVEAGRVTGFLGPNGAGKTTTMRALLGLLRPSAGEALVEGRRPIELSKPLQTVGAALEATAFHPGRSGRGHLRALAAAARIPSSRVEEVLELVELQGAAGRRVKGYSLGMRQRLALAAALLGDPRILILDEPANGLDPQGMRWLRDLLREQAAAGRTVLVSSHVLSEVSQIADELIVIRGGRLLSHTSLAEFTAGGGSGLRLRVDESTALEAELRRRGAEIERDGTALLIRGVSDRELGELAREVGAAVHELAPHRSSLEERFLEVMDGEEDEA